MNANGIKVSRNDDIRGSYMGSDFSGRVTCVETDQSGYRGTENDCRVFIQVDADMPSTRHEGWMLRKAGDCIIMGGTLLRGRFTRDDGKFDWCRISSASAAA